MMNSMGNASNNDLFQNMLDQAAINFESSLDYEVSKLLKESGQTLAVAESITGGLLSQRITTLAGSSQFFLGGIVTYHNKLKIKLAGVSPVTIKEHSVVSAPVALEMVRGIKRISNADICISTTGIAGPETQDFPKELTGRVFIGYILNQEERAKQFIFTGTRDMIRRQTTVAALTLLKQYLINRESLEPLVFEQ